MKKNKLKNEKVSKVELKKTPIQSKSSNPDFQQIHDLVKLINENNIGELSFEKNGYKLTIKQKGSEVVYSNAPVALPTVSASIPQTPPKNISTPTNEATPKTETNSNQITIKSPMIGTFYLKPSPDKANFVEVGSEIKKGQTICIVEAMKLFNEIESEYSGKVVKICVNNASPIEYDQALFVIEPM